MEDKLQNQNKNTAQDNPDRNRDRAHIILPILVRQARAGEPITYGDLAQEIDVHPRVLRYPLGYIGDILKQLGKDNNKEIPSINSLVVNKETHLPGEGISPYISEENMEDYNKLTLFQQRKLVDAINFKIYTFPDWYWVLNQFNLKPVKPKKLIEATKYKGGTGESPEHKKFKNFIAQNPNAIDATLKKKLAKSAITEYLLPSLDEIDVVFTDGNLKIAIEVKSKISDPADIQRGLFQCVKYKALLEAEQIVNGELPNSRVILALESSFPSNLIEVRNTLGIEVIDNISCD